MEITDRDPVPKWDSQEPGARLKPWLRELSFWRHDTNTPALNHGVKLHKALPLGTVGWSLADKFSAEQICETQRAGRSGPVPNNAGSERDFCGVHFAHQ